MIDPHGLTHYEAWCEERRERALAEYRIKAPPASDAKDGPPQETKPDLDERDNGECQ